MSIDRHTAALSDHTCRSRRALTTLCTAAYRSITFRLRDRSGIEIDERRAERRLAAAIGHVPGVPLLEDAAVDIEAQD